MFGRFRFTYFVSFLALLGPAVAANVYRMDFRTPEAIYAAKGISSRKPGGSGSVVDHVFLKLGDSDPWVSTTSDKKFAQSSATSPGQVYIYHIDPRAPSRLNIVDTMREFEKAKEEHPHPSEKEFAVKDFVPWKNIVEWDTYVRGKKVRTTTREEFEKTKEGRSTRSFIA